MKKIWKLYKKYEEVINYLVVGGLTTIVAVGSKLALLATVLDQKNGLELQIAEIISWALAVLFAYIMAHVYDGAHGILVLTNSIHIKANWILKIN